MAGAITTKANIPYTLPIQMYENLFYPAKHTEQFCLSALKCYSGNAGINVI